MGRREHAALRKVAPDGPWREPMAAPRATAKAIALAQHSNARAGRRRSYLGTVGRARLRGGVTFVGASAARPAPGVA